MFLLFKPGHHLGGATAVIFDGFLLKFGEECGGQGVNRQPSYLTDFVLFEGKYGYGK